MSSQYYLPFTPDSSIFLFLAKASIRVWSSSYILETATTTICYVLSKHSLQSVQWDAFISLGIVAAPKTINYFPSHFECDDYIASWGSEPIWSQGVLPFLKFFLQRMRTDSRLTKHQRRRNEPTHLSTLQNSWLDTWAFAAESLDVTQGKMYIVENWPNSMYIVIHLVLYLNTPSHVIENRVLARISPCKCPWKRSQLAWRHVAALHQYASRPQLEALKHLTSSSISRKSCE